MTTPPDPPEGRDAGATLTIRFDNPEARAHFVEWLDGSGEQGYWDWMEIQEIEVPGLITADFVYTRKKEGVILAPCRSRRCPDPKPGFPCGKCQGTRTREVEANLVFCVHCGAFTNIVR